MTLPLSDWLGFAELERAFDDHPELASFARSAEAQGLARLYAHGDFSRWLEAIASLPGGAEHVELDADAPSASGSEAQGAEIERALRALGPWRKGPFHLHGVSLDAEWRCNLKWQRVVTLARPFAGRRVLDVGSGNGYFSLRLVGCGASSVTALEPSVLYTAQYLALSRCLQPARLAFLPLTFEQFPRSCAAYDSVLSMGVLYHRRNPLEHLAALHAALRPGGELVLETLVHDSDADDAIVPDDRYAGMRNVWSIPTPLRLTRWLETSGFTDLRSASVVRTTQAEQRATSWSPGPSLVDVLSPNAAETTIEGWPAPRRWLVVARRPLD